MFKVIYATLAMLGTESDVARQTVSEIQTERELLLEHRRVVGSLVAAVKSENFNRTGRREMSANLRASIREAEELLA